MTATCAACSSPSADATICRNCQDQAAHHLRQIPWLHTQLVITLTRQARIGDRNGPRSTETPLTFDPRASVDLETFRADLHQWAAAIAQHRGVRMDAHPTINDWAKWLLRWNGAAAQHPQADQYLDQLAAMVRAATHTIDKAPDLRCLGPCDQPDCEAWLYVPAHAQVAYCPSPDCDAEYRVADRKAWLLEQAYGQLLTAHEMSLAIAELLPGQPITPNRISQWAARGRITKYLPHPRDPHKRVRFLVEDVIRQLHEGMTSHRSSA